MKIVKIKGCKTCSEVLIVLFRNDDGDDNVEIIAWHDKDNLILYQREEVEFESVSTAKRFIADFSELSANEFANSFDF